MIAYVAQPIDRSKGDPVEAAMEFVEEMRAAGFTGVTFVPSAVWRVLDPGAATAKDVEYLMAVNTQALEWAEFMVLKYTPGSESWGVPQEVMMAKGKDVPVLVVSSVKYQDLPFYLRGWIDPNNVFTSTKAMVSKMWVLHKARK